MNQYKQNRDFLTFYFLTITLQEVYKNSRCMIWKNMTLYLKRSRRKLIKINIIHFLVPCLRQACIVFHYNKNYYLYILFYKPLLYLHCNIFRGGSVRNYYLNIELKLSLHNVRFMGLIFTTGLGALMKGDFIYINEFLKATGT